MKREFLRNFKVGEAELPKEVIDAIMDENGRDIEAAKKPFADYDSVKAQLVEAGNTIESFKGMDIETIRKEADDWKKKYEESERDHAAKLAGMEFDRLMEGAVAAAKGRNTKAITALLDVDALKSSKNQEADIKAALEGLKADNGYLFEDAVTPPPYAAGTGTHKLVGNDTSKMTYTELCAYMDQNPGAQI